MKILFSLAVFSVLCVIGITAESLSGDGVELFPKVDLDDKLKREAESKISGTVSNSNKQGYVFKDAKGIIAARLNLTQGPISLDLVKTVKDGNKVVYVKNEKYKVGAMNSCINFIIIFTSEGN